MIKTCIVFPFYMTCLVKQEGVVLSLCRMLHYITFWPQMLYIEIFQENGMEFEGESMMMSSPYYTLQMLESIVF